MPKTRTWSDVGIDVSGKWPGPEIKTVCPQCSQTRKKKHYPCLNANLDKGIWHCWHCGWTGSLAKGQALAPTSYQRRTVYRRPTYAPPDGLPARVLQWFAKRGIPETIVLRHRIGWGPVYMPQIEEEVSALQFPYFCNGQVINIKYRDFQKIFAWSGERSGSSTASMTYTAMPSSG